jgi:type VI secretion system Hcp family effector
MAYEFYMTVEGVKQGKFPGTSQQKSKSGGGEIPGLRWIHEIKSPRDVATGQSSGKRQHNPMRVVIETGKVSPLFLQALCNNETLKNVTLNFVKTDQKTGAEYNYYSVKLTNASIASIKQTSGFGLDVSNSSSSKYGSSQDTSELDEIEFSYQTIEWEYKGGDGNTAASDSPYGGGSKGG